MGIRKITGKIHLWLGLSSGIIIVFLGITGCLLAFETEIRTITDRQQFTAARDAPYIAPEKLKSIAQRSLNGKKIVGIEYPGKGRSALAYYYDAADYFVVAIDPYTGNVLRVKDMNRDFFRIVLNGHYYLWLPPNIGQPIVAAATLIFLVMLVTGLILWWPRNRSARKQRFSVKWNAKWRRVNYDVHNVLGFYMTWVLIFIAVTGLVWGFEWFAKSVYSATSFGRPMPEYSHPLSDTTTARVATRTVDELWSVHLRNISGTESISVNFPFSTADPVEILVNHKPGTYYDIEGFRYDQYSGRLLSSEGYDAGSFRSATLANKIKRMNYDIHVGAVLGLTGKVIAFFASLVAASLPITGFYIWWGRNKKKKKPILV